MKKAPCAPLLSLLLLSLLTVLTGCLSRPADPEGTAIPLQYADLLQMSEADSFTCVTVRDAWHSDRSAATYILIPRDAPLPHRLPEGIVIRTPLRRNVVTTSVHAALLDELGAGGTIVGLTDTAYIISPEVRSLLHHGARSVGTAMQPDLERIRAIRPDALWRSPYEGAEQGPLDRLGVPLIECADYMETSPLGRAEWMRFYGRLVGRGAAADSLFAAIEREYRQLSATRRTSAERGSEKKEKRPTVFCDLLTNGVWYQPGGESTMGRLLADAGARYLWADRRERGSLPLDAESVYARAREADLWLIKYGSPDDLTYTSMTRDYPAYRRFKAWQSRHIMACNTLHTPFYETVPFHPERLLRDLIDIIEAYPALPHHTRYYRPVTIGR